MIKIKKSDILQACDMLEAHPRRHTVGFCIRQDDGGTVRYCPLGLAAALALSRVGPFTCAQVAVVAYAYCRHVDVYMANDNAAGSVADKMAAVREALG